ncbi:lipid-A-disaccharide synthase [Yoonia sp. R2331]|uniref:lipid-A-disaccharide synthase n=1 Tax=Yoonia sp. R2331 TaxID=3237238 RepID=UPI0034E515A8
MKVFVIAGEASGDKLGAALMGGLQSLTDVTFDGVGGPLMQAQGMVSRFPMDELSVMGLAEILPKYRHLKARVNQMAQAVLETRPDVLITIDSPDFGLRVAKLVKAGSNIRTVHYVAPTVWAWRAGRAAKMAQHVDQVLALFPFEPPLMEAVGMRCDFVGHPVVTDPVASVADAQAFRDRHKITGPLVLALPGSRRGEVARLSATFGAALKQLLSAVPDAQIVLPAAPAVLELVQQMTADWPQVQIIPPEDKADKAAAFRAADVALAASGTVSLELAANQTPMVIAYDMAWFSRVIISRMLLVDTVTLVNLVSDTRVVPEYIGHDCKPAPIAAALQRVLGAPNDQNAAMALTMERLGQGGDAPGLRAARAVLGGFAAKPAV